MSLLFNKYLFLQTELAKTKPSRIARFIKTSHQIHEKHHIVTTGNRASRYCQHRHWRHIARWYSTHPAGLATHLYKQTFERNCFQNPPRSYSTQARHATSRNFGTPVAIIHSPTQRMGDALAALRPSQLRTKPCSVKTTSMAGRLFGMQFFASLARC